MDEKETSQGRCPEDFVLSQAKHGSPESQGLAGRKGGTVFDGLYFGAAVSTRSDATARIRHGLWRAECVTKGACSVRGGATGDRWLRGHTTPVVYSTLETDKFQQRQSFVGVLHAKKKNNTGVPLLFSCLAGTQDMAGGLAEEYIPGKVIAKEHILLEEVISVVGTYCPGVR